jgi:predicted phosphate transport protein (TIGR00153 family)
MLARILPRDEGYFELFNQLAAHLTTSATLLNDLFAATERRAELVKAVKDVEHQADELMSSLNVRLDRSFITPIDREDIHLLASRLDDVVDLVDGTARRAEMLHIGEAREPARQLAGVLVQATAEIAEAVREMRRPAVVAKRATEIKRLEEQADHIYHEAVGDLFANTRDAIEVMRWKEMYDTLERTIDACQYVGTVLQSISLKNS